MNWNTRGLLEKCLSSIEGCLSAQDAEVIVVDNASADESVAMVQARFPSVHLIVCDRNHGFAKANNQALRRTTGRQILLLNPDTEVQPGALDAMSALMDANPGAGAVGPMLVGTDGKCQLSESNEPSLLGELWRMFHLQGLLESTTRHSKKRSIDVVREVDVLQGAALMVRREALNMVGLLDEDYFMYTEEVDLCYRLRKAGWTIHWLPTAMVVHHGGQSTKQVPTESFLNLYKSKIIFFRKHHGALAAQVYKLILVAASLARLIVSPLALFEKRERRKQHLALAGRYGRLLMEMPRL